MKSIKVGLIGCGVISDIYFKNCQLFNALEIVACADLDLARAKEKADLYNIPKACGVEELLNDDSIQIILNLTIPAAHTDVNLAALHAGKHVYLEKPLALQNEEAQRVLDLAAQKKLLIGCAPDTFLGAGLQTCRKLIEDGWIGMPVAAHAFMMGHGPESWHRNPEFFYKVGGGPMYDMGPYYLTAMINLLGPIERVSGMVTKGFEQRTITSQEKYGTRIPVEIPTTVVASLEFEAGPIATLTTSFDVWAHKMPCLEIYGTQGTLRVPDPNCFDGVPQIKRMGADQWSDIPLMFGFSENSRGIGLADMADAIHHQRPPRASGQLACHVLDVMQSIHQSAETKQQIKLTSQCSVPAPMAMTADSAFAITPKFAEEEN